MFTPNFPTDSFNPLTWTIFLDYVVVPFIAAHLIGKDSNDSAETGWEVMVKTGDYGDMLHGDMENDSELEDILDSNTRALSREQGLLGKDQGKTGLRVPSVKNVVHFYTCYSRLHVCKSSNTCCWVI
jgi:hypothetical protein